MFSTDWLLLKINEHNKRQFVTYVSVKISVKIPLHFCQIDFKIHKTDVLKFLFLKIFLEKLLVRSRKLIIWYLRLESVDNKMSNEGIALKPEMIICRDENVIRYDFF